MGNLKMSKSILGTILKFKATDEKCMLVDIVKKTKRVIVYNFVTERHEETILSRLMKV